MNGLAKKSKVRNRNRNNQPKFFMSRYQVASLNASTIIGVGVLVLPRSTTQFAHQFGWWSVLVALLMSILGVTVIHKLGQRFPALTFVEYTRQILGSKKNQWVGRAISFPIVMLYTAYWAAVTAVVARTFGEVVVTAVLVNTPLEVIVSSMLLLCFIMSMYDVEVVSRVNEVLLVFIVVPVLFIAVSAYQSSNVDYILPLLPAGHWMPVLMGAIPAMTSFLGFEAMLMFNGHIRADKDVTRFQIYGIIIPGFIYLLIVVAGIMAFGYEELSRQTWPTLELVKSVNVPGLVLERLEAVFLGVWVAAVFTTAGNWYYCANWSFAQYFGIKNHRWTSLFFVIAIYFVAIKSGENIQKLFKVLELIGYVGMGVCFVIPLFLLLLAIVRKQDLRKENGKEDRLREIG